MRAYGFRAAAGGLLIGVLAGCSSGAPADRPAPSPPASSFSPAPTPSVPAEEPHSLVYSATGTARVTSLTYELDGRSTTVRSVKLPWRKSVEVPADGKRHTWHATLIQGHGTVKLLAIFDGRVVGQAAGELSGTGSGSGSVSTSGDLRG